MPDDDDDENESSIRRACSLSDLSMGKGKNSFLFAVYLFLFFCDTAYKHILLFCALYFCYDSFWSDEAISIHLMMLMNLNKKSACYRFVIECLFVSFTTAKLFD